tara:strand:+ start:17 stop:784 length:768 start_codon:yes stop_codon:yes gene_type:complete
MYRLSNGVIYTGKSEFSKPYIICTGKKTNDIITDGWSLIKKMPDGSRVYISKYIGQLHIFKQKLNSNSYEFLVDRFNNFKTNIKHPCLENGLYNEINRIYPHLNKEVHKQYKLFIDYLNTKYDIEKKINSEQNLLSYSDDFGPFLLSKIGIYHHLIPEISNLYLAPSIWRKITWFINNSFAGPFPENDKKIYFSWNDLKLNDIFKNVYCESTALYLIAKFILIYEAWTKKTSGEALLRYIELVMNKNINPWKQLY